MIKAVPWRKNVTPVSGGLLAMGDVLNTDFSPQSQEYRIRTFYVLVISCFFPILH